MILLSLLVTSALASPLPQSLLDPSFDQFFDGSVSFNQHFNSFQQQRALPNNIGQQQQHQSFASTAPITIEKVIQNNVDIKEQEPVSPLEHEEALERHALQKQQLAEASVAYLI